MFVSRDNLLKEVDDLVNESLPKRIEETLKGDYFAVEAQQFINTAIDNALSRPVPELIGKIEPEQLAGLKFQITNCCFIAHSRRRNDAFGFGLSDRHTRKTSSALD